MSFRILIADRDVALLKSCRERFVQLGFEVATVTGIYECQKHVHSWLPDLIVLELELIQDEFEGDLSVLREDIELPGLPIVILAHCPYDPELAGIVSDSIRGWLIKPVGTAEVSRTVRRVLTTQSELVTADCNVWFG